MTEVTTDRGVWGFGTFFSDTRHTTDWIYGKRCL